jgi:hypothetical protein
LEERLLSTISLDDIHHTFAAASQLQWIGVADPGTVLLGSLSSPTSSYAQFNPFSEISLSDSLGLQDVDANSWECGNTQLGYSSPNGGPVALPNGWTR